MKERISWERISSMLWSIFLGALLLFLGIKYALPVLLPFFAAWLLSRLIRPLSRRFAARTGLPQGLCAAVLLAVIIGGLSWLTALAVGRLLSELGGLVSRLLTESGDLFRLVDEVLAGLGLAGEKGEAIREWILERWNDIVMGLLQAVSAYLPQLAGGLLSALPEILLVILVTVVAGFYFCVDGERAERKLTEHLPSLLQERLPRIKARIYGLFRGYLKAYLHLLLITLVILLAGLLILGVEYAFLLSLVIAVVDLLPVLGVGTVLIPWGLLRLLQGGYYQGFGLLILYLVILVIRQVTEPRVLGKHLGLHPLWALFATYAGFYLFGFWGMILGPVIATVAGGLWKRE